MRLGVRVDPRRFWKNVGAFDAKCPAEGAPRPKSKPTTKVPAVNDTSGDQ
jgi:hypothetical protein